MRLSRLRKRLSENEDSQSLGSRCQILRCGDVGFQATHTWSLLGNTSADPFTQAPLQKSTLWHAALIVSTAAPGQQRSRFCGTRPHNDPTRKRATRREGYAPRAFRRRPRDERVCAHLQGYLGALTPLAGTQVADGPAGRETSRHEVAGRVTQCARMFL
jgi:hypothetical protein